jgi:hypothetical protein
LTDATFGPAAARFNAQVNASVQYAQTAGNQDAAFDALGTNAGAAFNLTNIGDIATATVFNAPQVYVPGGTNLINSLQNDDILTGAGTADVLNATLGNPNDNGAAEITPELKGIETLNLKFDSTNNSMILDMQDSTGTVNVNISRIADGKSATVKNITEAATNKLSINNTNSPTTGTAKPAKQCGLARRNAATRSHGTGPARKPSSLDSGQGARRIGQSAQRRVPGQHEP